MKVDFISTCNQGHIQSYKITNQYLQGATGSAVTNNLAQKSVSIDC